MGRGLLGGVLAAAASPPGLFPGAEFLVLPGLALLFATMSGDRRPVLGSSLFAFVWLGTLAWSLRFVTAPGAFLMPALAALYVAVTARLMRHTTRGLPRGVAGVGFAAWWALFEWVRVHQPELKYPHGQVAHALYEWPTLLAPVRIVGESGMNLLVGLVAAGLYCALVERGRALARYGLLLGSLTAWAALSLPPAPLRTGSTLRVALVQNGIPVFRDDEGVRPQGPFGFLEHQRSMRVGRGPYDLWVWPEGAAGVPVREGKEREGLPIVARYLSDGRTPFVFGTSLYPPATAPSPERYWNAAFVCDGRGRELGRREKQILVPGGEAVPILPYVLSKAMFQSFLDWLREHYPFVPHLRVGREHPLPRLPGGAAFGVMICFEAGFPEIAADFCQAGAGFLCVLSNEAWYRGGAELDQMLAMSVFRALETGRPVLRSTTTGWTAAIGADGRVGRCLEPGGKPQVLEVDVGPVLGSRPAMRWGRGMPWLLVGIVLGLFAATKTLANSTAADRRR